VFHNGWNEWKVATGRKLSEVDREMTILWKVPKAKEFDYLKPALA